MILKTDNLSKTYKTGEVDVKALHGVNLEFDENTFYAIIGKSGSGKSTLLHLLSGMDQATEGSVIFGGKSIGEFNDAQLSKLKRKDFGFVFQAFNLLPELCAEENIMMPLYLDGGKQDKKFLENIMTLLDIQKIRKKFPTQLSGGEQQRVAIARALINKPAIIFADEPTGNLDRANSDHVIKLLLRLKREYRKTIILVTHDMDVAKQADVIIELQDGRVKRKLVRGKKHVE